MFNMPPLLVYEDSEILVVTLNNPEQNNVITKNALALFRETLEIFRDSSHLKVMLIRATGRYFCAGVDFSASAAEGFERGHSAVRFRESCYPRLQSMQRVCDEIEQIEKPVVVAHHAACEGGGLELSLSCDFRLAAATARYSFVETVCEESIYSGGISRLTRIVGTHWARYLVMANLSIGAERALAMGLVHEVFPDKTFDHDIMTFCRHLAGQRGERMAAAKIAIELVRDMGVAQARHVERMSDSALIPRCDSLADDRWRSKSDGKKNKKSVFKENSVRDRSVEKSHASTHPVE